MNERLHWRRQFVLAREPLQLLPSWQHFLVGRYHLYAHPDLEVNTTSDSKRTVVLIGYLFDAIETEKGNSEILSEIVAGSPTFEEFTSRLKPYAGRYVFIYLDSERCLVVHDALALRE